MRSQIRLAMYQPPTGTSITTRRYSAQNPDSGGRQNIRPAKTTATPMTRPPNDPARPGRAARVRRSWKAASQTSTPGRKSSPQTAITTVRRMSRCCRIRLAARQCWTTASGSVPKDCTTSLRPPPSSRSSTARANASPKFGSNSESLGGFIPAPPSSATRGSMGPSR